MKNKVEPFYQVHQTEDEHKEAIEEFDKVSGSFTTEEQYWACRAGFIVGYEAAKKKSDDLRLKINRLERQIKQLEDENK